MKLRANDDSGVLATYVVVGTKLKKAHNLRIPIGRVKTVRVFSVDVFGNYERPKRLGSKHLRSKTR